MYNSRVQVCISFSSEGSKHKMEWPMGLYVYFSLEIMRNCMIFFFKTWKAGSLPHVALPMVSGWVLNMYAQTFLPKINGQHRIILVKLNVFVEQENEKKRKQIKTNGLKNLPTVGLTIWLSHKSNGCPKLMLICYFWCNTSTCTSITFRKGKICLKLYTFLMLSAWCP